MLDAEALREFLLLVDLDVPVKDIKHWDNDRREDVRKWVYDAHLTRLFPTYQAPRKPRFLNRYKPLAIPITGHIYAGT